MGRTIPVARGSTFSARCPVRAMGHIDSTATSSRRADVGLRRLVTGSRGEALRVQLAARHPERTPDEIEDAVQTACGSFLDEAEGITDSGRAYAWIRTAAHRCLNREREHQRRELAVDPSTAGFEAAAADAADPAEQVIERETEADLAALVREVARELPERKRQVLALHGAGYKRQEIATHLGVTHRAVKRDLLEIMDEARAAVARLSGGGCSLGETLVVRWTCGLAGPSEASQAQLHLTRCRRCEEFHQQLNMWREKVGALLPVPAGEQAAPGVVERVVDKAADGLSAVKQQLADVGAHAKQQATATYVRAADPTPLAGARPGAVAAVVAGCLAVGTGAYTCVEQGINPLTALPGLEQREPDRRAETPEKPAGEQPVPEPAPAPVVEQPAADPAPAPAAPEPAPAPEPPPPPPPPEQSFEPASPSYPSSQAAAAPQPAPVTDGGVPEFGGP